MSAAEAMAVRNAKIAQIVIAAMQAMKKQDDGEEKKKAQSSRTTKCLRAVIDQQGEFDGKNVTKYLRVFWREMKLHEIDEEVAVVKFATLVEPEIKKVVEALAKDCKGDSPWDIFAQKMKEEFLLQDADRMTQAAFLDWINNRSKKLRATRVVERVQQKFESAFKFGS